MIINNHEYIYRTSCIDSSLLKMEQDTVLMDYSNKEKLEVYDKIMKNLPTGKHLGAYNIKRLMPDVKGKTILDLPCGIGHYVREMFSLGAARVIAVDIVSHQLELSKERDKEAGIPDDFVEYHELDAKIPTQISSELVDVCLSFHLFCFAENERDLRGMIQTLHANLKSGGCCMIIACYLNSSYNAEQKVREELEKIVSDEKVVQVDSSSSDRFKPRRYHTVQEGFHFDRYFFIHSFL